MDSDGQTSRYGEKQESVIQEGAILEHPRISCLIPTYERHAWLKECLLALAADPYENKEIIVINDGGSRPDEQLRLEDLPDIKWIHMEENQGHVRARNAGLKIATGDYILLCDDDDLLIPGHLSHLIKLAMENSPGIWHADAEIIWYRTMQNLRTPLSRRTFAMNFDPQLLRKYNTIIPSGIHYPIALHEKWGLFDETMEDYWDWDFFLRMSTQYPIYRMPYASVLYLVSEEGNNLSAKKDRMQQSLLRLIEKHSLGELPVGSFPLMVNDPILREYWQLTSRVWSGRLESGKKLVDPTSAFLYSLLQRQE